MIGYMFGVQELFSVLNIERVFIVMEAPFLQRRF